MDSIFPSAGSGEVRPLRQAVGIAREARIEAPVPVDPLEVSLSEECGRLLSLQEEGYWVFPLEADVTIPAEYVLLQRFLGRPLSREVRERIAPYLRARQLPDGGWPLYEEGFANLSASVKAYFALKVMGDSPDAPHMVRARLLILTLGGAARVNVFTRITLALFGQLPWRTAPAMPVEIVLLPSWFFFHLRKVSYWSRTVMVPLLLLYAHRPVCRLRPEEGIPELFVEPPDRLFHLDRFRAGGGRRNLFILLDRLLKRVEPLFPSAGRAKAVRRAEEWMRERMRGEGGLGAIFPAMANAVMALKVLGYPEDHPDYTGGVKAVDELLFAGGEEKVFQPCHSPIWDCALTLCALLEAELPPGDPAVAAGVEWLMGQQVSVRGDWAEKAPGLESAGWAFQFENALYPDVDDTPMVLMALLRAGALDDPRYRNDIARAVRWVLGMQSSDGGWGAFDIDNSSLYLNDIPFADHGALLDPSTADLTGRCLELLSLLGFGRDFPPVARALEFLRREQEESGAWFGRWGVNYIYGTWSVLMGLRQAGEDMESPWVRRAVAWLKGCQNGDGGWGETCYSYDDPSLAGQGRSTPSQSAWALLGLMAAAEVHSPEVARGVSYLQRTRNPDGGWDEALFTGTGFPRVFYLRYHGYSQYFPVWALGAYRRLLGGGRLREDEVRRRTPADFLLRP